MLLLYFYYLRGISILLVYLCGNLSYFETPAFRYLMGISNRMMNFLITLIDILVYDNTSGIWKADKSQS